MEPGTFSPVHVAWVDAFARIALSILFALSIGIERFVHKKPVDFRPFVIISLSSCGLGLLVMELPFTSADTNLSIDPAKVNSGVMGGIGFLGAGALFRDGDIVRGAASASSIWSAGAIGLICGMGFLWLAGFYRSGLSSCCWSATASSIPTAIRPTLTTTMMRRKPIASGHRSPGSARHHRDCRPDRSRADSRQAVRTM